MTIHAPSHNYNLLETKSCHTYVKAARTHTVTLRERTHWHCHVKELTDTVTWKNWVISAITKKKLKKNRPRPVVGAWFNSVRTFVSSSSFVCLLLLSFFCSFCCCCCCCCIIYFVFHSDDSHFLLLLLLLLSFFNNKISVFSIFFFFFFFSFLLFCIFSLFSLSDLPNIWWDTNLSLSQTKQIKFLACYGSSRYRQCQSSSLTLIRVWQPSLTQSPTRKPIAYGSVSLVNVTLRSTDSRQTSFSYTEKNIFLKFKHTFWNSGNDFGDHAQRLCDPKACSF